MSANPDGNLFAGRQKYRNFLPRLWITEAAGQDERGQSNVCRQLNPHTRASNASTNRSSCFIPAAQNAFSRGFNPNGARAST